MKFSGREDKIWTMAEASPRYTILKASAGAGKTRALAERYLELFLSDPSQKRLRNLLAITFSNNATMEMKERILSRLKEMALKGRDEKAFKALEVILDNYSDFRITTIDSFMATIFRACAMDFGFNPDFEILTDYRPIMEYAFDLYLRDVKDGSEKARILSEAIERAGEISDSSTYLWDPGGYIFSKVREIHEEVSGRGHDLVCKDLLKEKRDLEKRILCALKGIHSRSSGLRPRKNSSFHDLLPDLLRGKGFPSLLGKGLNALPFCKPSKKDEEGLKAYEELEGLWDRFKEILGDYALCMARLSFLPYGRIYRGFMEVLEEIKRKEGRVFISDVGRRLLHLVKEDGSPPEIYFRLGERIEHFLIDEFQDTSPLQWDVLYPLIEEALSSTGSLFVVGDTKQAIYGFRDADYRIMKDLEEGCRLFPSAEKEVRELTRNYRSQERIVRFNERFFKEIIPALDGHPMASQIKVAADLSGLTSYIQDVADHNRGRGYVEVEILEDEEEAFKDLIRDLERRGRDWGEIGVLTFRNEKVMEVSGWLNEMGLPFISYSSLDVRRRKVTGEIIHLLRFLDCPVDDLAFSTFLLGDLCARAFGKEGLKGEEMRMFLLRCRRVRPLYKAFRKEYPEIWKRYFDRLFRVAGYFPLYDLMVEAMGAFRVFELLPEEEATFVRILDAVKTLEGKGCYGIKDFLEAFYGSDRDESLWDLRVPVDTDAIQVMTIHKAKGLGFPVAVVILEDRVRKGRRYGFERDEEGLALVRLARGLCEKSEELQRLREDHEVADLVNYLNTLYVAFTRAKEELYILGVKRKKGFSITDLLPAEEFTKGKRPGKARVRKKTGPLPSLFHHTSTGIQDGGVREALSPGFERGDFIHRVLSRITYLDHWHGIDGILEGVEREMGRGFDREEVKRLVRDLLFHPDMRGLFEEREGRVVLTEEEFSDGGGNLYRMDRVVLDPEGVTVVDYKTGSRARKHHEQMGLYMEILKAIYPDRPVRGVLYYMEDRRPIWIG